MSRAAEGRFRRFLLLLLALSSLSCLGAASYPERIEGRVVAIHDGDTLTVLMNQVQYKIRLEGIDAPELSQAFGRVAKDFVSDFAFGRTVLVRVSGMDRYGRYLGELLVGGRSLNRELPIAGLAWHYRDYSTSEELARLESEAHMLGRGLWKDTRPTAPWDYRRGER
jgi:endonuclease YncB( thermonuclease family)